MGLSDASTTRYQTVVLDCCHHHLTLDLSLVVGPESLLDCCSESELVESCPPRPALSLGCRPPSMPGLGSGVGEELATSGFCGIGRKLHTEVTPVELPPGESSRFLLGIDPSAFGAPKG